MSELIQPLDLLTGRADELFREQQENTYCDTDRLFARLMFFQWIAAVVAAVVITPFTWDGESRAVHIHVWTAIFLGGAITVFPIWMTRVWPGATITRHAIAVAQMLMSALFISLSGGRIETHFHVFGSLVILSFYRDWRVLVSATLVVGLDHFVRGIYWPYSVYGVLGASPWRSMEHAVWVAFEDIFLVISCLRSVREMRFIANRTAAVEASERDFREIFELAPIGVTVVDLNHRFVRVNSAYCKITGYSSEELAGRRTLDITVADDVGVTEEMLRELHKDPSPHYFEKRYVRKDEEICWVGCTSSLIRGGDKPLYVVTMVEDISERKKTQSELTMAKEEADRANRAKSEFLSRMSHELRTPLNAILGFGQLLERYKLEEKQKSCVDHIKKAGRHLLDLINEVLDISRIEADRLNLSLEPVGVTDALREGLDLVRPLAAENGITLVGPIGANAESHVLADRQRLKQVLLNLLTNGVKYTPRGGEVCVSYENNDSGIRMKISDTGIGIPREKMPRVFTPFDRLGAEQSGIEGNGLGLALCQRLVRAMEGTIGVESVPQRGSTFWVQLSAADSPLKILSRKQSVTVDKESSLFTEARTVLYIEDNFSNLMLVEELLKGEPNVELLTAMQGRIGLDLARKHAPDLILLDLHLPDLPGWDVLNQLQANDATRQIPVVVVSADATRQQIDRLTAGGARGYLTKPINVTEFLGVLSSSLNGEVVNHSAAA
jgi:two-component system, sensor histidine kinase and response regulator